MVSEAQDEELQFWHEHELPRKRRRGYDDITPLYVGEGDESDL